MRNVILPAAALLLLSGGAMAQTGINSGAAPNQGACGSDTDPAARTRCLNEMQLLPRDPTSGGIGGTGINSGASTSGSIEANRSGAESAIPGEGVGLDTGADARVNSRTGTGIGTGAGLNGGMGTGIGTGAGVNTGANTGVNTGAGSRALGGNVPGGLSAGGTDRHPSH
jgi:hypothetical protein